MHELEIPLFAGLRIPIHRVRISPAKKAKVVGALQIFDPVGITPEFLVIVLNCPHIGATPMHQFLFTIAHNLLFDVGKNGEKSDRDQRNEKHERDQHVTVFRASGISSLRSFVISQFRLLLHKRLTFRNHKLADCKTPESKSAVSSLR